MNDVVTQVFGLLGMAMNSLSYQGKKQRTVILAQLFGSLFFAVNMFMLNAVIGGLLNVIGIFRALVYSNKEKLRNVRLWNGIFAGLYLLSYIAVFTVFGKAVTPGNLLLEILPLIAMMATTISFSKASVAWIRRLAFVSSPCWLIYNCINGSIGGILCEVFSLVSALVATIRLDSKGRGQHEDTDTKR